MTQLNSTQLNSTGQFSSVHLTWIGCS